MKSPVPFTEIKYWRSEQLFNIGLANYTLTHHSFPRHFHEHYVIELVTRGVDKFYHKGKTHTAGSNEFVFINPGEVHTGSTVHDNPLHYYSVSPTINELQQVASVLERSLPQHFYFQQPLTGNLQLAHKMQLLFHTVEYSFSNSLQCEELFLDFMNSLLDEACSSAEFTPNKKDIRIQQLIDFMHASFTEQISLQQMCEQVRISPYHLIRLFRTTTGLSPYEYLLVLRTEYAKQLLQKGVAVKEAALEAGFYDASHFYRQFKKISGATPKIFRSSK